MTAGVGGVGSDGDFISEVGGEEVKVSSLEDDMFQSRLRPRLSKWYNDVRLKASTLQEVSINSLAFR